MNIGQIKIRAPRHRRQKRQPEPGSRNRNAQSTWRKTKILLAFQECEKTMIQGLGDNRR